MYQIEIEIQDSVYIVLYQYLQGEDPTYDYPGSPDEVTIFEVYKDDSENIVTHISWSTLEELTERIEQYHLDNF
jgi:hypothetical protein